MSPSLSGTAGWRRPSRAFRRHARATPGPPDGSARPDAPRCAAEVRGAVPMTVPTVVEEGVAMPMTLRECRRASRAGARLRRIPEEHLMTRERLALAGLEAFVAANAFAARVARPHALLGRHGSQRGPGLGGGWQHGDDRRRGLAGEPARGELSVAAGALLVGWIGVQLAVWEGRSWTHPASLAPGCSPPRWAATSRGRGAEAQDRGRRGPAARAEPHVSTVRLRPRACAR